MQKIKHFLSKMANIFKMKILITRKTKFFLSKQRNYSKDSVFTFHKKENVTSYTLRK